MAQEITLSLNSVDSGTNHSVVIPTIRLRFAFPEDKHASVILPCKIHCPLFNCPGHHGV